MNYKLRFTPEADNDLLKFNNSQKDQIGRAIEKVLTNPLHQSEGGYGKPLGNKRGRNLTGCFKITLKKMGIRIVYELIRTETTMEIIVIAARADEEVYDMAAKRIK